MIELGLAFNLIVRCKLFGINAIRYVNDGLRAELAEIGGILACDGGDAIDSLKSQ